jgi:hypothetical protein
VTVVEAPPQQQPSQEELEALIEEARQRARRRRLAYFGGGLAVALAVGVALVLVLLVRGGSGTAVPKGFVLVHARGPVQHFLVEDLGGATKTLDLATGRVRPTRVTQELWYDARLGISRTDYRQDGRLVASWPEQNCVGTGPKHFCIAPPPFDLRVRGLGWPPRRGSATRAGEGTFRGHRVIWIEGLVQPGDRKPYPSGDQVAFDAVTHRPVARRTIARGGRFNGRVFARQALTMLPDLPAKDVSFVVPKGGPGRNPPSSVTNVTGQHLEAARDALGTTPLWLGRSFRGHRLQSVVAGTDAVQWPTGRLLHPARFARFDYGSFAIKEFGRDRPFWQVEDPASGTMVLAGGIPTLVRNGVLVTVNPSGAKFRLDRADALAFAKALRPVPRG